MEVKTIHILTALGIPHHLDAAAVAGLQRRLVPRQRRVVERVLAADIRPAVTLVAVDRARCGQGARLARNSTSVALIGIMTIDD